LPHPSSPPISPAFPLPLQFAYTGESIRDAAPAVLAALGEAVTQPKLWPWEVDEGVHELEAIAEAEAANPTTALVNGIHAAAFGPTSALGHAPYPGKDGLHHVNSEVVRDFLGARYTAGNIVVSGTNIDHAELVALAEATLGGVVAGSGSSASGPAAWVGGETLVRTSSSGAAHVALALPAPSVTSAKFHALGVLTAGLGRATANTGAARAAPVRSTRIAKARAGDASFAQSLSAFAFPYADAGLFGIAGSAADADAGKLVAAAVRLLKEAAASPFSAAELDRAKKAYKLSVAAAAESRTGGRDDIGSQILSTGKYSSVSATLKAIDAVTAEEVAAVARTALGSQVAIFATGSLNAIPRYDVLASQLK
jgi:predicted Zn-dependent peptidase